MALAAAILGGLGPDRGLRAQNVPTNPGPRTGAYMVYDSTHGRALLFGGWTRAADGRVTYPNDLWAWDGTRWRALEPPAGTLRPAGRDVPVVAYDEARDRLVVFGGRGDDSGQPRTWLTDVWEWDGTQWHRIAETGIPHILHPVATYDPSRKRVVLYGGGIVGETGAFAGMSRTLWEWDGRRWAARDTAGPPDQIPAAAVGTRDGVMFLVSGTTGANRDAPRVASRTWRWSDAWSEREEGPPFNNLQAAAGGTDGTIYFYQAWESWVTAPFLHVRDRGGTWRRIEVSPNPGVRNTVAATWDSRRRRFVVYGGVTRDNTLLADTWEFDGERWSRR